MTHRWIGLLLAALVTGTVAIRPATAASKPLAQSNGSPAMDLPEPRAANTYQVGPGDVLDVTVYGEDELTRLVTVQHGGEVAFPLLGDVQVAGLTAKEAENKIEELLAKDFLVDPHVTVRVKEYRSQWVTLVGEVARPGKYYLSGPKTLLDLLIEAGGFTARASGEIAISRRNGVFEDGESTRRLTLTRDMLPDQQKRALAIFLSSGDIVTVPGQEMVYISGHVNNPGSYPLTSGLTVLQAVSLAGGLSKFGSKGKVEILRKRATEEPRRIDVDLGDIEDGDKPDVPLEPGDVIKVGKRLF